MDDDIPPVSLLLALDKEYREKASAGSLNTIAPKRFNPEGKSWLPVMNVVREGWSFTLLFSNTAKAHELKKTDDWVVVYFSRAAAEKQCTIVTEYQGRLNGRRVIRGREEECEESYELHR